jgi:hypothetical protein
MIFETFYILSHILISSSLTIVRLLLPYRTLDSGSNGVLESFIRPKITNLQPLTKV